MTTTATWTPPALWSVPRAWLGERCFVLCGGESLREQRQFVPHLNGRIIAVKHGVLLRPDADVLFFAGERPVEIAPPLLKAFRGTTVVVRGKGHPVFPDSSKRVWRTTTHDRWSTKPTEVAGYDAGTSAINLAILFGATEIVLLGYDMGGGRWFNGEIPHFLPNPIEAVVQQHLAPLPALVADAVRKGIRIVNCSPISRAPFKFEPLEAFL
jgi:hypothetical protein